MSPELKRSASWVASITVLGNLFEWYDFIIYGYFSLNIATTFFPSKDQFVSLLAALAAFGVGYISRPLGAIVLGLVGDRRGRKTALLLSFALMAVGTAMIGVLPSYNSLGIFAPVLLMAARLVQGFAVGGNFGSSATYFVEIAPEGKRGLYGSLQQVTIAAGLLLGSAVHSLLSTSLPPSAIQLWAWRIPFLAGALLAPIAYFMNRSIIETPLFSCKTKPASTKPPDRTLIKILAAFGFSVVWATVPYIFLIYLPTLSEKYFHFDGATSSWANTIGLFILLIFIPISGFVSDHVGRKPILLVGCLVFLFLPIPIYSITLLKNSKELMVAAQIFFAVSAALILGPAPTFSVEMFDASKRITGLSIANSLATTIFGGFAPFIASWLILQTSSLIAPFYYVLGACVISGAVILKLPETAFENLK